MKAFFFDFDGTLADSAPSIINTIQSVFRIKNIPIPSEEEIRQTIGLPLNDSLQILGRINRDEAINCNKIYQQLFSKYEISRIGLFPKVTETIKELYSYG